MKHEFVVVVLETLRPINYTSDVYILTLGLTSYSNHSSNI
jgi:hypothetical protein